MVAAVLLLISCGGRLGAPPESSAASAPCTSDAPVVRTPGAAAYLTLGAGVAPELAAVHRETLFVTSFDPCADDHDLLLWQIDTTTKATQRIALGLNTGGLWHALAIADDGTAWVGTRDVLAHVHRDHSIDRITVPAAQAPLPPAFVSRAGGAGSNGAISAMAVVGPTLLIGRAGHHELTTFDTGTHVFGQQVLPPPLGEVKSAVTGGGRAIITATRSGIDPLAGRDAAGLVDPVARSVVELPLLPGVLSASGDLLGIASWLAVPGAVRSELRVVDVRGAPIWSLDAQPYDATRFAVRRDGMIAVRAAGAAAEVAIIGADGRESRRVAYAAVRDPLSTAVPAFAFAAYGPDDALWFGVRGRPEIYRIR